LDSKGYQILQGLFALRSGGLVGQGLGEGMDYVIPQVHTDYLFAVIGEEFGLLGTLSLLVAYLSLAFWAMQLLQDVPDQTLRLTGLGLSLLLHIQVFMVVGGILRIVPFSGMTLPLVSYGSTSFVAQLALLGLVTGLGQKRSVE
jgi:cell division protein FtsW (lipid II flippase)